MTDKKFQDARSALASSQALVDHIHGQNQTQQGSQDMGTVQPIQEQPQRPQGTPDIATTIKEVVTPMFDDLKRQIQKEESKEQAVELKIEGAMTPKP